MKGSGNAGNTPFIVVEGHHDVPSTGGGDPTLSHGAPLFHGFQTPEEARNYPDGNDYEGFEGVSRKKGGLPLQQDVVADNPINQPTPSGRPELEHTEDGYESLSGRAPPSRMDDGNPRSGRSNQYPLRSADSLSAVATHKLRRATTSMKEGIRHASVHVAYAGEKMGKAWHRTLDSAMILCAVCGGLAIILIAIAVSLRSWRYQHLNYENQNGFNTSRVDLGLGRLQRIQILERANDAGLVKVVDPAFSYDDVIRSAYCTPDKDYLTDPNQSTPAGVPAETTAEGSNPEQETSAPEGEEESSGVASAGFMGSFRMLQAASEEHEERGGPLEFPPPYSVTVGRNPAAPGTLNERFVEMREILLGSTVFDIHCSDLSRFRDSGALFIRMMIAFFVAAGIGMLCAILAMALAPRMERWTSLVRQMPISVVGSVAWIVALMLQLFGIAAWGVGTDVAACVTPEGGAAVCTLGIAAGLSIGSLVLTLIATLSFCIFFTHKFIRDLGLEKEREQKLREASERRHSMDMFPDHTPEQGPSFFPAGPMTGEVTEGQEGGPPREDLAEYSGDGPLGGAREGLTGGPHPQARGETNSPLRSFTVESHNKQGDAASPRS